MSIKLIRERIASLQLAIPGVKYAYSILPRGVVQSNQLPLFINFVRDGEYDHEELGDNDILHTRSFNMWLLVKPAAEGEEGESENLTEPWIETVVQYFMARPSLGNLIGVQDSYIVSDTGPKKMVWPGSSASPTGTYWGIEFRLKVIEFTQRTFATNE